MHNKSKENQWSKPRLQELYFRTLLISSTKFNLTNMNAGTAASGSPCARFLQSFLCNCSNTCIFKTCFMRTLKKSFFLITLFLMAGILSFGRSNDSLTTVIKEMANSNIYAVSYTTGYAGTLSKQYQRFEQLISLATEEQLLDLAAQNKNAVVRLYAFQALKQKKIKIPDTLIYQFQHDNTIVIMLKGCIGDKKSVNALAQQEMNFLMTFQVK